MRAASRDSKILRTRERRSCCTCKRCRQPRSGGERLSRAAPLAAEQVGFSPVSPALGAYVPPVGFAPFLPHRWQLWEGWGICCRNSSKISLALENWVRNRARGKSRAFHTGSCAQILTCRGCQRCRWVYIWDGAGSEGERQVLGAVPALAQPGAALEERGDGWGDGWDFHPPGTCGLGSSLPLLLWESCSPASFSSWCHPYPTAPSLGTPTCAPVPQGREGSRVLLPRLLACGFLMFTLTTRPLAQCECLEGWLLPLLPR